MGYVRASTANPLGWRPWNFALSTSGLAYYAAESFPVPNQSGTPAPGGNRPARAYGMGDDMSTGAGAGAADQAYNAAQASGFQQDASTLPPAPAGYQYAPAPGSPMLQILVPVPKPQPSPMQQLAPMVLLGGAALAGWYWLKHQRKPRVLPVVPMPAVRA